MMASFKPKSVVFDYFEMPDDTSGKYRAKCKQCTATVAAIGMTTSNLLIHLKASSMAVPDDMKTKIRSVLLSKIGGCRFFDLNRDYKNLIGEPIHFKKLGFSSLEELVKSIPDVARIKNTSDGPKVFGILNNPNIRNHTARKAQYRPDVQDEELERQNDELIWQKELQPNLKGLYCLCMAKRPDLSREMVNQEVSKYGDLKETSYTERFIFLRFAEKDHALAALKGLSVNYDVRIPTEKNNPRRVIKEKDVTGEMPAYPVVKASDDRIVKSGELKNQLEVFIGNLSLDTTQAELGKLVSEFNVLHLRIRGNENKKFAFLLVPDMAECEKIVSKLHRAKFKDRLLIVQASYENTEKRTPQESKVILQNFVKGGLQGKMAVAKTEENDDVEESTHSRDNNRNQKPNVKTEGNKQSSGSPRKQGYHGYPDDLPDLEPCEQSPPPSLDLEEEGFVNSVMENTQYESEARIPWSGNYRGGGFNQNGQGRSYTGHGPPWGQPNGYHAARGARMNPYSERKMKHGEHSQQQDTRTQPQKIRSPQDNYIADLASQIELCEPEQRHKKPDPIVLGGDRSPSTEERVFELYCSGFPYGTQQGELLKVFQPYGASYVKMKNNRPGGRTFAFIVFDHYEDAADAFTNLDGQKFYGRELIVCFGKNSVIDDRDLAKKMGNLRCTVSLGNDEGDERRKVELNTSKKHSKHQGRWETNDMLPKGVTSQGKQEISQHSHQNTRGARPKYSERLDSGDGQSYMSQQTSQQQADRRQDRQEHSKTQYSAGQRGGGSDNRRKKGGGGSDNEGQKRMGDNRGNKHDRQSDIYHNKNNETFRNNKGQGEMGDNRGRYNGQVNDNRKERREEGDNKGTTSSDRVGLGRGSGLLQMKHQAAKPESAHDFTSPPPLEEVPIPELTIPQAHQEAPVPVSMRQEHLACIYKDCFPGLGFPDFSNLTAQLCVFPRVEEGSGYFWGQLLNENMSETLALAMQIAEQESLGSLQLYQGVAKRAAALYYGEWCRVWVEGVVDVLARVFFVDWGNIEMLPIADLRELPQEFWKCQPVALPFKMDDHDSISELIDQQVDVQFISHQDPQYVVTVKYIASHVLQ